MRRYGAWCLAFLFLAGTARAAQKPGKLVHETWDTAYLEGNKAGHVHTTTREIEVDGRKLLRTEMELNLSARRFRDLITLSMSMGTDETPEGKVVAVSMRQTLGKDQDMVMTGAVEGDQLHIRVSGQYKLDKKNPWNDKVVGLYRQQRLFRERQVKPGDEFTYLSYEPQVTLVITTHVAVKDYEEVSSPGGKKQRVLRVVADGEKIGQFKPPPVTSWLNKDLEPVRSEFDVPGLGKLLLVRSPRATALGENVATMPDIGRKHLIPLNRSIPRPLDARSVVYRITVQGDDDPASTFAQDSRQEVKNVNGQMFELHVHARRGPQPSDDPGHAADEYLQSCYFINSADARVKEHARRAVGVETDPWKKALRIERYVHDRMENNVNFTEAFATADHVARTLEGDCTEHAVLAAAMCRAVGVPSRTAVGLIYVDTPRGPVLAFHMWAEVYVDGQWLPIDATLGRGYVGADHLKIADHSWHDTQSLTPLLPVLRVLGKLKVEVVRVNGAE